MYLHLSYIWMLSYKNWSLHISQPCEIWALFIFLKVHFWLKAIIRVDRWAHRIVFNALIAFRIFPWGQAQIGWIQMALTTMPSVSIRCKKKFDTWLVNCFQSSFNHLMPHLCLSLPCNAANKAWGKYVGLDRSRSLHLQSVILSYLSSYLTPNHLEALNALNLPKIELYKI